MSKTLAANVSEFLSQNLRILISTIYLKRDNVGFLSCFNEESLPRFNDAFYTELELLVDAISNGNYRLFMGAVSTKLERSRCFIRLHANIVVMSNNNRARFIVAS